MNRFSELEALSINENELQNIDFLIGMTPLIDLWQSLLGWSDGQTFLPVSFRLLASGSDKNLLVGSQVKTDNRTLVTKRRTAARKGKPTLVLEMLKAVKGTAAEAKYVLFDSWFAMPSLILSIRKLGYHVVARPKNHENYRYTYQGENLSINRVYKAGKKRRGLSRYILSVIIEVQHKEDPESTPAKLVYVRDKANRKKWIALISADVSLSEDEIIALYGKRLDIETYHKMIKSYLRLAKEFQTHSFDAMTAHTAVILARLSLENRENKDKRSFGALVYDICKELDDISFAQAFCLIISTLEQCFNEYLHLAKIHVDAFVEHFIDCLPSFIKDKLALLVCES